MKIPACMGESKRGERKKGDFYSPKASSVFPAMTQVPLPRLCSVSTVPEICFPCSWQIFLAVS